MKTEKNRKLKGTVLLAVVATMALLIIFMGTTLILASAANNRAHKTYATSQAEYTAQAAIKAFTTALEDRENPSMIAAVQNLGSPTYPDVVISNTSIGHIGYYESDGTWVENKIKVEPLGESPAFVYGIKTFGGSPEWYKPERYRITATARVGRDEKTISLYMTSMPLDGDDPKSIEGFQTIGETMFDGTGNGYNGALVAGIKGIGDAKLRLDADSTVNCNYVFVNGDIDFSGNGAEVNVNTSEFKMVATGNVDFKNGNFIHLNYTPSSNLEAKEVPYMFVNGKITGPTNTVGIVGNTSPFNIFAGWVNLPQFDWNANIYLMDSDKTSEFGALNSHLYKWTSSVVNGTDRNLGEGGSIYSMGNVKITNNNGIIQGDVRVAGNFENSGSLTIDGDLIVGGNIASTANLNVSGTIYCDSFGTFGGLKPGYTTENLMADIVSVDPASIGWQGQWAYYDPSDGSLVKYDWNNNPMVLGTVYKDPSGNEVPESEAKEFSGSATPPGTVHGTVKPLSAMMGDLGFDATDIYPQSMTREKIYMFEDPVGSGNWVDAPEDTRFIKTLSEIQNAIGMNPTTGALPYPSLPTEGIDIADYESYTTGGDYNGSNLNPAISDSGVITKSCKIDTNICGYLEIEAKDSDIWIILDNATLGWHGFGGDIVVKDSPYTVKFFVNGTFVNEKRFVGPKSIYDEWTSTGQANVKWDDRMNIEWYGAVGSTIKFENNGTMCGAARAPYTKLIANVDGKVNVSYENEYGQTSDMEPVWIGNALFNDADVDNNFVFAYTKAGGGGSSSTLATALGDYELSYFAEY